MTALAVRNTHCGGQAASLSNRKAMITAYTRARLRKHSVYLPAFVDSSEHEFEVIFQIRIHDLEPFCQKFM